MSRHPLPEKLGRHKPILFMWIIVFVIIAFTYALRPEIPAFSTIYSQLGLFSAFVSIIFVGSFWIVYYFGLLSQGESRLKFLDVFTLRDFLNEKSLTRKSLAKMREKASHSLSLVEILATLTGIIATLGIVFQPVGPNSKFISQVVTGVNFTALVLLIIAADKLDTCLNEFEATCKSARKYYSTGIRCAYSGMHLLLLSFVIATLLVSPLLTCGITVLFFIVGYTYWFPSRETLKQEEHPQAENSICPQN